MKLYSWFLKKRNVTSSKKDELHEDVPKGMINCTMWPTAKVKNNAIGMNNVQITIKDPQF